MVLGYHLILTTYGFWLPNDPRGSWSRFVGNEHLFRVAGCATKVNERQSVAGRDHDWALRLEAKRHLLRPSVRFDGRQALAVARGFAELIQKDDLVVWACAILPDHVHLVVERHRQTIEVTARRLKAYATKRLTVENRHPFAPYRNAKGRVPTPWTRREWKVFLDTPEDIKRAIHYVEQNPVKEGKRRQCWSFTKRYGASSVAS